MTPKQALIIGQAQRPETRDAPFPKSNLWKWFERVGWAREEVLKIFHFDALVGQGTPKGKKGRVPPKLSDIKLYRPQLLAAIDRMRPKLIVPVGGLAVREALEIPELSEAVGRRFVARPFGATLQECVVIPLPHPSGVSLWLNSAHNRELLEQALGLLREELQQLSS